MRASRAAIHLFAALVVTSCSAAAPPPAPHPPPPKPAPPPTNESGTPPLPTSSLGDIESEALPVVFARRGDDALVLRVVKGRWVTQHVGADGAVKGAQEDVGPAPPKAANAVLRPLADGYLAAFTDGAAIDVLALDAQGKAKGAPVAIGNEADPLTWVDVLPNAHGALVLWESTVNGRPNVTVVPWASGRALPQAPLARSVLGWEALATERGAVLAIVEEVPEAPNPKAGSSGGPAKSKKGKGDADPKVSVKLSSPPSLGRVVVSLVDEQGKATPPVVVSPEASAEVDVDLAQAGSNVLVTWTDERGADPAVFVAAIDASAKVVVPPRRATRPSGGQTLLALVAHPYSPDGAPRGQRAMVAWEENERVQHDDRLIHLATIGADGTLGKNESLLAFHSPNFSGPPDLAADGDGFAAVTLASPRLPAGTDIQIDPTAIWPAFVRFNSELEVTASEPLFGEAFPNGIPAAVRELSCRAGVCTTLANGDATAGPAPLAVFSLPVRKSPWLSPVFRSDDGTPPNVRTSSVVFDGDHLTKVAAALINTGSASGPSVEGGTLAAWLTYAVEAAPIEPLAPAPKPKEKEKDKVADKKDKKGDKPDKPPADKPAEPKPRRDSGAKIERPFATIGIAPISSSGVVGGAQILSRKAVSIGGIALASLPGGKKPEVAIAWVARDKDEPQVFVSKLGADGVKTAQKGVTVISRKKGNVVASQPSDVAIAYTDGGAKEKDKDKEDGFIVGWVDTRDGNPEVYVAKIDRSLKKTIPDKRITEVVGDASDLQIAVRGNNVYLVWSDARGATDEGHGDIYTARLEASTLKKLGAEQRLFASRGNSRSPQIGVTDRGLVVAWIEDASPEQPQASFRIVELDENGNALHAPRSVAANGGSDPTIALGCSPKICRSAITFGDGALGAFSFTPGGGPTEVKTLLSLGDVPLSLSMPLFGTPEAPQIFLAADGSSGTSRVRRMELAW